MKSYVQCVCMKSTRYFIQMRENKKMLSAGDFTMNSEIQWKRFEERQVQNEKERDYYYSHDPMVSLFLLT